MENKESKSRRDIGNYYYFPNEHIGGNQTGRIYKAYHNKTGEIVALRVVPLNFILDDKENTKLFIKQIEIMSEINNENVVELIDCEVGESNDYAYIFTEFCEGGDLRKIIKEKGSFSESEAKKYMKQIAKTFLELGKLRISGYYEDMAIIHKDLKPANILLKDGKIKIDDFAFSKVTEAVSKNVRMKQSSLGATPAYSSPQILAGEAYSYKCDVWSAGMIFYEMLYGKPPFEGATEYKLYTEIIKTSLVFPSGPEISPETQDLISKMLKINEDDRLDWRGVYNHVALKGI